jgi:uncharacterized BrkB/YihY/UPF0761 family membrane protein
VIAGVSTLMFNGNPLMRFDGYYVFSDWLEIPNLSQRAALHLGFLVKRFAFGIHDAVSPATSPGEARWLLVYGVASFIYRMFVSFSIVLLVASKYFFAGVLLAIWGVGVMLVTLVSGSLQAMGERDIELFGRLWSLGGISGVLLYLLGFAGEVFVLTSIYLVMPVGRLKLSHALIGGVTAAVLWEVTRHILVWYLRTLSQVNVVYGSLTTAIVVLLSLELAATLLLFGAQVIAEYERIARAPVEARPQPLRTG